MSAATNVALATMGKACEAPTAIAPMVASRPRTSSKMPFGERKKRSATRVNGWDAGLRVAIKVAMFDPFGDLGLCQSLLECIVNCLEIGVRAVGRSGDGVDVGTLLRDDGPGQRRNR